MARGIRAAGVSLGETCRRCGSDEWKHRSSSKGYAKRYCVPCHRSASQKRGRRMRAEDPAQALFYSAKKRATKSGMTFSLTPDDIREAWPADNRCPILGMELQSGRRSDIANSPSLDRINNAWGYEKGNIAIISHRANALKRDGTAAEHERLAAWMRQHGLS